MTEPAGIEATDQPGPGVTYQGVIAIEWPPPRPGYECAPMPGWKIAVYDALSGSQITTVTRIELHASASDVVAADVTMFTDADGQPLYQLEKAQHPETGRWSEKIYLRDGDINKGISEGTFPFLVAEMRVAQPAPDKTALEPRFIEPCPAAPASAA